MAIRYFDALRDSPKNLFLPLQIYSSHTKISNVFFLKMKKKSQHVASKSHRDKFEVETRPIVIT